MSLVNTVKHIKTIQEDEGLGDLSSDEIENLRRSLETAGIYLQNSMKIIAELSPHNFDIIMSDEIVKSSQIQLHIFWLPGKAKRIINKR